MKTLARFLLAILIVSFASVTSFAYDVPPLNGRVNDNAGLLTADQRSALTETLRALEEKTTAQVAILTVKDLQGGDIKSFALKVAETWKLGQKGKDNGLLILYTVKEDRYRLEVGYGLEGALPDGLAGSIIRQQLRTKADPKHGKNDFGAAFIGAVEQIASIINAEFAKDPTGGSMKKPPAAPSGATLFILFAVAVVGALNKYIGTIVGTIVGIGAAQFYSLGGFGLVALPILAAIIGYFGSFIINTTNKIGGAVGSTSGSSSGSFSGGSDGGFSGGGGSFGGGGADG